jgi:hypothetical protein
MKSLKTHYGKHPIVSAACLCDDVLVRAMAMNIADGSKR